MRKRKLFQLLALFDEEDSDRFQTYLDSPFFNNSPQLIQFWGLWRTFLAELPEEDPIPEVFLAGTGIKVRRMDRLCSELKLKAEQFLAIGAMERKPLADRQFLLEALNARNAPTALLQRHIKQFKDELRRGPNSSNSYFDSLKVHWLEAEVSIRARKTQDLWNKGFRKLHDLLDSYHLLQKLKLQSAAVNARYIFNQLPEDGEEKLPEAFLSRLRRGEVPPLEMAYLLSIDMYDETEGESHFLDLLALLGEHAGGFEREESLELYGYALNYCIHFANQGRQEYLHHASALYRDMLDKELSLERNKISALHFKNMVALHCRLGMLDWVREFIQDYGPKLDVGPESPVLQYNQAVLAFHLGDFRNSIRLLKENIALTKDDVFYGMDARVYLWKSYFEYRAHLSIEEVDEMFRLYDSFRIFIDRNKKISDHHRRAYRNFIREFKRFVELLNQLPVDAEAVRALREVVAGQEFLANKVWFLQKIDHALSELG